MDDPWANAWGEPSPTNAPPTQSTSTQAPGIPSSTWSAPSVSAIHGDNEDDLSIPSWSTGPVWDHATESKPSLWGSDPSQEPWSTSNPTYGGISFSKSTEEVLGTSFANPIDPSPKTPEPESPVSRGATPPPISPPPLEVPSPPPLRIPTPPPLALPPSEPKDDIDGFGTFESAADEPDADEQWSNEPTYVLPSAELNAWGDAVSPTTPEALAPPNADPKESSKALDDAWARAIESRERQERHVPPEVFAALLRDLHSLSDDLWPSGDSLPVGAGLQGLDPDRLKIEGLAARLIPEGMTLPSTVQFSKTFSSKKMAESLKLTKNAPITRSSPMAMYLASKGSLAWEATVKSQPLTISDDVAPLGWKIVEQNKEAPSTTIENKRKTGLFSFFNRKAAGSVDAPHRASSPVPGVSAPRTDTTPRASMDSIKPTPTGQGSGSGRSTPSLPSSTNPPNPLSAIDTKHASRASVSSLDGATASNPPSAVSRFFNRFSRGPPQTNKEPMALSSDDLEFLSDATSPTDTKVTNSGFDAFDAFLSPPPNPSSTSTSPPLLPPLLPPPPKHISRPTQPPPPQPTTIDNPFSAFESPPQPSVSQAGSIPPAVPAKGPIHSIISSRPPSRPVSRPASPPKAVDPWGAFDFSPPSSPRSNNAPSSSGSRPPSVPPVFSANPLPPLPKPTTLSSTFKPAVTVPALAPPPGSRSQTPSLHLAATSRSQTPQIPTMPPPPGSRSQTPNFVSQPIAKPPPMMKDDDDFADFLSSPPANPPQPLDSYGFGPFGTTQPTTRPPAQPTKPLATFDDFDDFLQGPSDIPPALPAKPTAPAQHATSAANRKSPPPAPSSTRHARKVSKADHSRTLSLLETAAARGNWLSPPSPLPEALPPPNAAPNNATSTNGKSMQAAQSQALSTLTSSTNGGASSRSSSPWALPPPPGQKPSTFASTGNSNPFGAASGSPMKLPPPPGGTGFMMQPQKASGGLQSIVEKPLAPLAPKPAASNATGGAGGLSAQDLSFFEGF